MLLVICYLIFVSRYLILVSTWQKIVSFCDCSASCSCFYSAWDCGNICIAEPKVKPNKAKLGCGFIIRKSHTTTTPNLITFSSNFMILKLTNSHNFDLRFWIVFDILMVLVFFRDCLCFWCHLCFWVIQSVEKPSLNQKKGHLDFKLTLSTLTSERAV